MESGFSEGGCVSGGAVGPNGGNYFFGLVVFLAQNSTASASKIHRIVFQLGQKTTFCTGVEFYHRKKKSMGLRATTRRHGIRAACSWQTKSCLTVPWGFFFPIFRGFCSFCVLTQLTCGKQKSTKIHTNQHKRLIYVDFQH